MQILWNILNGDFNSLQLASISANLLRDHDFHRGGKKVLILEQLSHLFESGATCVGSNGFLILVTKTLSMPGFTNKDLY